MLTRPTFSLLSDLDIGREARYQYGRLLSDERASVTPTTKAGVYSVTIRLPFGEVAWECTADDFCASIDDYSKRFIEPAIREAMKLPEEVR